MSNSQPTYKQRIGEAGIVSIMVATVLMLVIGLLVIGFAEITRRNQRETLDRQLSTQAFYAAESGINEAKAIIGKAIADGNDVSPKDNCAPNTDYPQVVLDSDAAVEVTCLLVDDGLQTLVYGDVTSGQGTIVPVVPSNPGDSVSQITLRWRDAGGGTQTGGCTAGGALPTASAYTNCSFGVLRVDVAPASTMSGSGVGKTVFLKPRNGGGATSAGYGALGDLHAAHCTAADGCSFTITGLSGSYYLRLQSLYRTAAVEVSAGSIELSGQVQIDATGKAGDVLRRVQVRMPLYPSGGAGVPVFAIDSAGSLCKRFLASPSAFTDDAGCRSD